MVSATGSPHVQICQHWAIGRKAQANPPGIAGDHSGNFGQLDSQRIDLSRRQGRTHALRRCA